MLKPASLQHAFDLWFSGDPAFRPIDDEKERTRLMAQARETGDLSSILVEGERPTFFKCRPLRSSVFRKLVDKVTAGKIGQVEASAIAFRSALVGVQNLGDVEIKMIRDDEFGEMAKADIVDMLDGINPAIVSELGAILIDRAVSPGPK